MTKREKFDRLRRGERGDYTLFHPILMHFAARFHKKTYSEFATDYRALVESFVLPLHRELFAFNTPVENLRAMRKAAR